MSYDTLHAAPPTRLVACDRCGRFTAWYHTPPRAMGSADLVLCPACWRRAQKAETNAAAVGTAVAEALAWRLIEQEERIATTRAAIRGLRQWTRFSGWAAIAEWRGYLWEQLAERRSLKGRLAKEMER